MHLDSWFSCSTVAKVVHFDPNCGVCVRLVRSTEKTHTLPPLILEWWPNFKGCLLRTANTVTYWNLAE